MRKVINRRKAITNRKYLLGDFDKDGVANIDDRYPFNKKRSGRVNKEVSLAKTFRYIESKRKEAHRVARPIAKREGMKYRVKGTYSIINKAVRRDPSVSGDFIGLRYTAPNKRIVAKKRWSKFNTKYKVKDKDNKYETLKGTTNPYRAYHSNFLIGGLGAEAQFRTKKFGVLNDNMHLTFKNRGNTKKFLPKSNSLIKRGY